MSPGPPGRRDSSGIRLYYTATLRPYDAGIMELGLVYTPVMAIPPGEDSFILTGYCTDKCTQLVSACPLLHLRGERFSVAFPWLQAAPTSSLPV